MGEINEDRRELIICALGRLDGAALALIESGATLEEQHAILGDLTAASLAIRYLDSANNLDVVAAIGDAMAARERIRVPKTPVETLQLSGTATPRDPGSVSSPMDRRAALLTIATLIGAPAVDALTGLDGTDLAAILNSTTRRIRARMNFCQTDQVYRALVRHADHIDRLLATHDDPRLHAAHAEALGHAGFIAFYDLAWPQTAARHLSDALRSALRSDNAELVAWVHGKQAHQATFQEDAELARHLVRRALAEVAQVEGTPIAIGLWIREVTASVLPRDERGALTAIEQAETSAGRTSSRADWSTCAPWSALSPWIWPSRLGACYLAFGRLNSAETALDQALVLMPNWHRDRGTVLADQAQVAALRGELDQAATTASEGLSSAVLSGSRGDQRRVLRSWRLLAPHQRDVPAVRELGEQLRTAGLLPAA